MQQYGFTQFMDFSNDEDFFHTVENADLPNPFPNIDKRTKIQQRQIANDPPKFIALVRHGVKRALKELEIEGKDCEGLVLSSCNPANQESLDTLARYIASENGIAQSIGVNFACSGFPASVEKARNLENKRNKHILMIQAEITSALVDWDDENTAVVFGDGLAATSIVPGGKHPIHYAKAVGDQKDEKKCLQLVEKNRTLTIYNQRIEEARCIITMGEHGGKELYRSVPKRFLKIIEESEFGLDGVDRIVAHQANGKFIDYMYRLHPGDEKELRRANKIIDTIEDQGNIVSASIPVALSKSIDSFNVGDMVACPAKGAGENFVRGTLSEGLLVFEVGE
jgi:3-oxoacyl-[acyl-carrier-protein] synthase-3